MSTDTTRRQMAIWSILALGAMYLFVLVVNESMLLEIQRIVLRIFVPPDVLSAMFTLVAFSFCLGTLASYVGWVRNIDTDQCNHFAWATDFLVTLAIPVTIMAVIHRSWPYYFPIVAIVVSIVAIGRLIWLCKPQEPQRAQPWREGEDWYED